jgi:hypothetical protein
VLFVVSSFEIRTIKLLDDEHCIPLSCYSRGKLPTLESFFFHHSFQAILWLHPLMSASLKISRLLQWFV